MPIVYRKSDGKKIKADKEQVPALLESKNYVKTLDELPKKVQKALAEAVEAPQEAAAPEGGTQADGGEKKAPGPDKAEKGD